MVAGPEDPTSSGEASGVAPRLTKQVGAEHTLHGTGYGVDFETMTESRREEAAIQDEAEFQLAADRIGQVIGICSNRKWKERKKEHPDPKVIEFWDKIDDAASIARDSLYDLDRAQRAELSAEYRRKYLELKELS